MWYCTNHVNCGIYWLSIDQQTEGVGWLSWCHDGPVGRGRSLQLMSSFETPSSVCCLLAGCFWAVSCGHKPLNMSMPKCISYCSILRHLCFRSWCSGIVFSTFCSALRFEAQQLNAIDLRSPGMDTRYDSTAICKAKAVFGVSCKRVGYMTSLEATVNYGL